MISPSDRIAIISGDREVSFKQMLQSISLFARVGDHGVGAKTLILSENREGWFYALYATWANRGIAVPVDAACTVNDVAYMISDCHPAAAWVSASRAELLRDAITKASIEVAVHIIDDYEVADPSDLPVAEIVWDPSSTCLICYTSGTTGNPKGVMLSFENVMANVEAVWHEVPIFSPDIRTLVLLPLHHVLPLVGTALAPMVVGGGVAISPSLAAADIMATLQRGKIGIMVGVPRLWQTLFRGIKAKIDANAITRTLYSLCYHLQNRSLSRIVFNSVRKKMGGHIAYCVAGGAALDRETAMGLKTLGLDVLEGYGMTETAPIIAFTRPGDIRPGCVGLAMPSVEVKLVDGELLARGRNVMQGYYNRPEETASIIDSEGFVHTGDLATIDDTGHITITGRRKEIIVLSNGKNVNPVEIEEKLELFTEQIKEAAVVADNDLLRAIIVPQNEWAGNRDLETLTEALKRDVLQPYNANVAPYKKLMSLTVTRDSLPRTRLDKLQRYRLLDIVYGNKTGSNDAQDTQTDLEDNRRIAQPGDITPTGNEVLDTIVSYLSTEKRILVRSTDHLETDLALDSLDKVSLQGFIEQNFGVKISAAELSAFPSVGTLADYITDTKTRSEKDSIDWHRILTRPVTALKLPRMAKSGVLFTRFCRWIYNKRLDCKAFGLENIPTTGPVIFAPNHQSFLDAPLVVAYLDADTLRNTFFYAKSDHVRGILMRWLARNHGIVIMDMRTLKDSIRTLGQVLTDGKNLVIFPEGTRTRDGHIGPFKKTFAILAQELDVPVVPVRIEGAYESWPRHRKFPRRHKVSVTYLPPIRSREDESYEEFATRVRSVINDES